MISGTHLVAFLFDHGEAICTAIGGVAGWTGNVARARLAAQRGRLDAGQQALELLARASERDARMDALLASMTERVNELTRERWQYDGALQELYAQAIAARLLVYELDAKAGRPPRQFEPLPPYPIPPAAQPDAAETAGVAGVDAPATAC
ncbi:hypothetical protein Geu3261_0514_001 [Komagataeibacter europaeus NBRC 3261]|uniref:Uncharacterized protein n=1 Tax=Komagataeibacter europaeus NBRC 3261 TaxID=1234669 RepID=A0A0D6Q3K4_KOMEU|nr:hypothetical protein [Komagataeibacter europaeus]GAN98152.1 hypothetical protein Geu3261_0514_001 [Komagataeibacter europaeus NBRC 3261]